MLGVLLGLALILGAADLGTTWLCLTGGLGDGTIVEGRPQPAKLALPPAVVARSGHARASNLHIPQTLGASPAGSV